MPKLTISLGLFDEMLGFCMLLYICEEKARSYQICYQGFGNYCRIFPWRRHLFSNKGCRIMYREKENLCVYGLLNETWKVNLSIEEVPPELSELALDINHVRDGMQKKD
nr:uncharacterized protein LOC125422266 isoform X2 [Ziziphus jujuba var. spinosa]